MPQRVYHYTVLRKLLAILNDGEIRLSPTFAKKIEKPVVWCSTHPDWEPTASCLVRRSDGVLLKRSKREIHNQDGGLVRIALKPDVKVFTFEQYRKASRISKRHARTLVQFAETFGADLSMWRVCFLPLGRTCWDGIEVYDWNTGRWVPHQTPSPGLEALARDLNALKSLLPALSRSELVRVEAAMEGLFSETLEKSHFPPILS